MADHQVSGAPIENQPPCVYVAYTWPAPTPVKLAFDSRHARSNPSLSALSIWGRGAGRALVIAGELSSSRSANRGCLRPADNPGGVVGRHLVDRPRKGSHRGSPHGVSLKASVEKSPASRRGR